MGIAAFNLKNLDEIHFGKFNIVYESAEAVMDKEFLNSLKSQQSAAKRKFGGLYSGCNAHSRSKPGRG